MGKAKDSSMISEEELPTGESHMDTQQNTTGWHSTACALCYVNCEIEVMTTGRDIMQVRGNKAPVACWLAARAGLSPAEALEVLEKWQKSGFRQF